MTQAVFATVPPGRAHYESFYLRAVDPHNPRGLWLRHTVHQRPGEEPTCALWQVLFERGRPPAARKDTFSEAALAHSEGDYVRIDLASFGPDHATGPTWELALTPTGQEPLRHLPSERLYRTRLPRTKTESPQPLIHVSGRFRVGDREVHARQWRGMVGHNWGEEHAERWLWLNALNLPQDGWMDLAIGRVRTGPLTTPWIGNGAIALPDGTRHRLGGLERIRSTRVDERPEGCRFVVRGEGGIRVEGMLRAPREELVAWRYADPRGGEHHALNCSIAEVGLDVTFPDGRRQHLHSAHGGVYELGTRETDHGIAVRPEPDG